MLLFSGPPKHDSSKLSLSSLFMLLFCLGGKLHYAYRGWMGKNSRKALFTVVFSILTFISVVVSPAFGDVLEGRAYPSEPVVEGISSLPYFSTLDVFGRALISSEIKGDCVYVQFLNPDSVDQRTLLQEVYDNYQKKGLRIIAFSKVPIISPELSIYPKSISLVTVDYEKYKKLFNVPPCCETFYLFDQHGRLVTTNYSNSSYSGAIKPFLLKLLDSKNFQIEYFIPANENIDDVPWLKTLGKIINKENDNKYRAIFMFTSICPNCLSGRLVEKIENLQLQGGGPLGVLLVLPHDYNQTDIENLKNILRIKTNIISADELLALKWDQLIEMYGQSSLGCAAFLLNKEGFIINIMRLANIAGFMDLICRLSRE